jgi:hypothetical protein
MRRSLSQRLLARVGRRVLAVAAIATFTVGVASAQNARPYHKRAKPLVAIQSAVPAPVFRTPAGGTWQAVTRAPFGAGTPMQLTDGRVLVHESCTSHWWTLTPDSHGSYVNGTWKQVASMQDGYAPLYFSSAVLADGRVIVAGGEYNNADGSGCKATWTSLGAIYDPNKNKWTVVNPPNGWTSIGDAQNVVMPDGTYIQADALSMSMAAFNPATLTWTDLPTTGKVDVNDEEGWTLLPDGSILTVDAFTAGAQSHAERYYDNTWHDAGNLVKLNDSDGSACGDRVSYELGPAVLMANGKVFAVGATGHNAIYTPPATLTGTGSWVAGPDFPAITDGKKDDSADGPAALMPNGKVLVMASPCVFHTPSHFYEFNGSSLTRVSEPPSAPFVSSYYGRLMVLPNGQILYTDGSHDVEVYVPTGKPKSAWKPTISNLPARLRQNESYKLSGKHLNGLSQASVYGDDSSSSTNYPLVRITHTASGKVTYARTSGHSSMGVAVPNVVFTHVKIPAKTPTGASKLEVIANGIASAPKAVTILAKQKHAEVAAANDE